MLLRIAAYRMAFDTVFCDHAANAIRICYDAIDRRSDQNKGKREDQFKHNRPPSDHEDIRDLDYRLA